MGNLKRIANKSIKYGLWTLHPIVSPWLPSPSVLTARETLRRVLEEQMSLARFGDGELRQVLLGLNQSIQVPDKDLDLRLTSVLKSRQEKLLVCLPGLLERPDEAIPSAQRTWKAHRVLINPMLRRVLGEKRVFGETQVTRPYIVYQDAQKAHEIFELWKEIFAGRQLLVIEGHLTRLGVDSDLFDRATCVRRILCPATNAFGAYDKILKAALKAPPDSLFVLALGKTATVLAADLAAQGRQALDVGNLDIEYYWFRNRCTTKVPVPGKYTYEAKGGTQVSRCDDTAYVRSIWKRIEGAQDREVVS